MPAYKIDIHPDNFLPCYQHTIGSRMDVELLYGSRDSGKSRNVAQIMVTLCMNLPKFKCPLIRKVGNTVKDSQWAMIKSIVEEWKFDQHFKFTESPLEIECTSGGLFLARGLDEPKKLKSITDPTHAWVEEGDGISEYDWTIITTSLRSNEYDAQIWMTFNPDVPGLYEEHWIYKKWFAAALPLKSFTMTMEEEVYDEATKKTDIVQLKIRATHSTWRDNPYCKPTRKAIYLGLKKTSEYDYLVYSEGEWGTRKTGGEFLKAFQANVHVKQVPYNPRLPLYFSIDNNVLPYCACSVWQIRREELEGGKFIYYAGQIAELPARDPYNSALGLGKVIVQYLGQIDYIRTGQAVNICGDRSTKNQSTIDEKKRSFFQIVLEHIVRSGYRAHDKFLPFAPAPSSIADFCNDIMRFEMPHLRIEVDKKGCPESVKDYGITKQDRDGNILKINKSDYEGGPSYQHNGHLTDTFKDFIVQAFYDDFLKFCSRNLSTKPQGISVVSRVTNITP